MANESIRIRTTPGQPKNIRFKLEQDFDFLEVLSLKISQEDLYQTFCSNYGVVVGRVIANKGFGVPNAKVSVFVPISSEDEKNLILKDFYPFKTPYDKDSQGVRYNLLLSKSTCELNRAVGTFPTKEDILGDDLVLEVFDKYYKYTTKTNSSGDFMIFGVPVGSHTVHMDADFSDVGAISIRPYDLIEEGYPENLFESKARFKASSNLDSLPQIKLGNIGIDVIPFWGNPDTCEIGITRVDFDTNFEIKPNAFFLGSIFSDSGKMGLNRGCNPRNDMGDQNELRTGPGLIEMIRVTEYDMLDWYNNGELSPTKLEKFDINNGDLIDDDGVFVFLVPMNIGHIITDEFGERVPSPNPSIGVATKGMYRFKMKFAQPPDNPKFRTGTIFFPSLGPDFGGTEGMVNANSGGSLAYANGTEDQRWTDDICQYNRAAKPIAVCGGLNGALYQQSRIKLDFHTFEWKQIYTIAHYIKKFKRGFNRFSFLGIKNTDISAETNLFPFNNAVWKFDILYYMIAFLIDYTVFLFTMLIVLMSTCIKLCLKIRLVWRVTVSIAGTSYTIFDINWTLVNFCYQICPFAWLGGLIPSFVLPCEGGPDSDGYLIPPGGGTFASCNPNSCGGSTFGCDCFNNSPCTSCNGSGCTSWGSNACICLSITGVDTTSNICLTALENWNCCVKLAVAEDRNAIRRVFNDSWVFGTAYLFQFKYKRKIKKSTGAIRKEKYCGPGSDNLRGDNYVSNQCCLDTDGNDKCDKCLLRGPGETQYWNQFRNYHRPIHNYAIQQGKTGAADVDDIIYCNALMSTKIVSLGRIEMCLETLEDIESMTLANLALKSYRQLPNFYTGTFYENGWDPNYWINVLKETSYEDPRDVLFYLAKQTNPPCALDLIFWGDGFIDGYPCHEYELKDNGYFIMKEVSKIYANVEVNGLVGTINQEQFDPISNGNPYSDVVEPPAFGGFNVDLDTANRFSPCGGDATSGGCDGQPNNHWTNTSNPNPEQADSDSWDKFNSRGNRNNRNTRSNIPYYYFGMIPGKTAITKFRQQYLVQQQ